MSFFSEGRVLIALGWLFSCLEILVLARIVLSWIFFITHREWRVTAIVIAMTEPMLAPIRNILNRFEALRNFPFDLSILVFYLIISFVKTIILG